MPVVDTLLYLPIEYPIPHKYHPQKILMVHLNIWQHLVKHYVIKLHQVKYDRKVVSRHGGNRSGRSTEFVVKYGTYHTELARKEPKTEGNREGGRER